MKKVRTFLSFDFDFFTREDPMWDWGHDENWHISLKEAIWYRRYAAIDLYKETNIMKYADFHPLGTYNRLHRLGYCVSKKTGVLVGDSHTGAYHHFKKFDKPELILHFDAHHDCFKREQLDCGSWLYHLYPEVPVVWVVPKWKEKDDLQKESIGRKNVRVITFEEIVTLGKCLITSAFIARSSDWVPPHHDIDFMAMLAEIHLKGIEVTFDKVYERKFPTESEAKNMYEENEKMKEELRRGV